MIPITHQVFEAFGSTATILPMSGDERAVHGATGRYAVHFSFPAQSANCHIDRNSRTLDEAMTLIISQLVRGDVQALRRVI
ncbi:hypothetical protein A4G28_04570 [Mycobacterium ostraviense]|uniref:Uncharacterized protein n=1 Tax=Mycobacterium ostraviense TaxID=2738409 RepID=A0A164B4I8_9MYCO|nr:hypothetical protein A4G28_04570 [Mycobacterium ostraviense]